MNTQNQPLTIHRLEKHLERHYEIKDPSVIQIYDGSYRMYASIGNSRYQEWLVGRFAGKTLSGEWHELEPVTFENLSGPQLCAPAITFEIQNGQPLYTMYIQTACFESGGVIALATSTDGQHFYGQPEPIITKDSLLPGPAPVIGVYDVGVSEIKSSQEELLCMVYSGYRRVGCGDLYVSTKKKQDAVWSPGTCLVSQEEIPFHNHPDNPHFEWGLEGAKIVQIGPDCFLLIGVSFLPLPEGYLGTRQRVFFAASTSLNGPYRPLGLPFAPQENEWHTGENGHPDTIIHHNDLVVMYQERSGDGQPWHLRSATFDLKVLESFLTAKLNSPDTLTPVSSDVFDAQKYYLDVNLPTNSFTTANASS